MLQANMMHKLSRAPALYKPLLLSCNRWITSACTGFDEATELTDTIKHAIEEHWRDKLPAAKFDTNRTDEKFYVLSMFPYPSGCLHMGHVRVYTISDTLARFHRMCGRNVFHPIGWDAFGLPAENAAIQRDIEPADWTRQNIAQMKEHLEQLGCAFDWKHELLTCSPQYYKWTQKIFLMLYERGLAYQNEALVNWDPVDKTVLANEQVDAQGRSWRSGAQIEKRFLKQWFVRTTKFAEQLWTGLDEPTLVGWEEVIKRQRNWMGKCDGYAFNLRTTRDILLRVWTRQPAQLKDPSAFIVLKRDHPLAQLDEESAQSLTVENPFANTHMPIKFCDQAPYAHFCNVYLAAPSFSEADSELAARLGIQTARQTLIYGVDECTRLSAEVLEETERLGLGGYKVSSQLSDWLISRQRHWGTPIPIVHCPVCGTVAVPEQQLPVLLPARQDDAVCECPKCGCREAKRERDTMDTFVDSSWYFLRYLDPHNEQRPFEPELATKFMPVDIYIGGEEHSVLHLYYARFMNHFLNSCGLVPSREPFTELLVQGIVKGRTFKVASTGNFVRECEVENIDEKAQTAVLKTNKEPVNVSWDKMSKSKFNGVDPAEMFRAYGTDATRLFTLSDLPPRTERNWDIRTFSGIVRLQARLWKLLAAFHAARSDPSAALEPLSEKQFAAEEVKLRAERNYYLHRSRFFYNYTHALHFVIYRSHSLVKKLSSASPYVMRNSKQFERALATQIIALAPMAPHFSSELWSKFASVPGRLIDDEREWQWDSDVLEQRWPDTDDDAALKLRITVNNLYATELNFPCKEVNAFAGKENELYEMALEVPEVKQRLRKRLPTGATLKIYPFCGADLLISADYIGASSDTENSSKLKEERAAQ